MIKWPITFWRGYGHAYTTHQWLMHAAFLGYLRGVAAFSDGGEISLALATMGAIQ